MVQILFLDIKMQSIGHEAGAGYHQYPVLIFEPS